MGVELVPLVGIFVGGASSRMGRAKGLLLAPSEPGLPTGSTLLARTEWTLKRAFPEAKLVLVGVRPEYAGFPLRALPDALSHSGPLGGLVALLAEAEALGAAHALVVGCDFPYVSPHLLTKLATFEPERAVVAPRIGDFYQPLVARYRTDTHGFFRAALSRGSLSLQRLFAELDVATLPVSEAEERELRDWDSPGDIDL